MKQIMLVALMLGALLVFKVAVMWCVVEHYVIVAAVVAGLLAYSWWASLRKEV